MTDITERARRAVREPQFLGAVPVTRARAGRKLVSIVLPLHNEEGSIPELHRRLTNALSPLPYDIEMIFVDDGSKDSSALVVEGLAARDPRVKYIGLSRNFGHQYALTAGMDLANGDAVICMDSDLQHPPELLPVLLQHWEAGFPIVYTVRRTTKKLSWFKRLTAAGFYGLMRLMSPFKIPNNTSDFRLIDRRVCDALRLNGERERFYRGMIPWAGFKQLAVEFDADARHAGVPSYTVLRMVQFSLNGIVSYSYMPLYALLLFTVIFVGAGAAYGGFVLYRKLIIGDTTPGQASILLLMLLIGTAQLLATCVAAAYSYKAYQESKSRPLYIVDRTIGFDL